jgi:hypothetical protein
VSTPITLSVGDITLTYNTMHIGMDHGMLFQECDRKRLRRSTINYEFYEEHPELDLAGHEECFCRTLQSVVSRLELLGFTLDTARVEYERSVETDLENREELTAAAATLTTGDIELLDPSRRPAAMSFDEFLVFIRAHAVNDLSNEFNSDLSGEGRRAVRGRFVDDPDADRLPREEFYNDIDGYSERSYFGGLIGFLSAYATLRVLAENPANLNLEVVWDHGAFVHAGWARMEQFVPGARRTQTYLIATEGSSDTHILKRALNLLRPDIEDFFKFIEMEGGHPFPGTGNLAKFAEGLVKIDVHNKVVFIFDNDAEGCEAHASLHRLEFPANMRAMVLPSLEELRSFPALGPEGVANADINGRAAAIECYLDLRLPNRKPAQVTWTNFKDKLKTWHGSLDFKTSYVTAFFGQTSQSIEDGSYDTGKLAKVLDALLQQCHQMASEMAINRR